MLDDFSEKIWLHRCDSLEKLHELDAKYPNVEVDVVFRKDGTFDVTHDVNTSFSLVIDPYFSHMEKTDGKMWMGIKNLEQENKTEMLSELEKLVGFCHIGKDNLIVESRNLEALRLFTKNGYYTSYYVPFDKPEKISEEECNSCISILQKIVDGKAVCALSFPCWWYSTIKERLHRSIDLLTWRHRTSKFMLLASPRGRQMLKDDQLEVILVKEKGSHHR